MIFMGATYILAIYGIFELLRHLYRLYWRYRRKKHRNWVKFVEEMLKMLEYDHPMEGDIWGDHIHQKNYEHNSIVAVYPSSAEICVTFPCNAWRPVLRDIIPLHLLVSHKFRKFIGEFCSNLQDDTLSEVYGSLGTVGAVSGEKLHCKYSGVTIQISHIVGTSMARDTIKYPAVTVRILYSPPNTL